MNNYLYYDTQPSLLQQYYGAFQAPFQKGSAIYTQLPARIAYIRSAAAIAFAALTVLSTRPSAPLPLKLINWTIGIASAVLSAWTIYKNVLCRRDPLIEAFNTITNGQLDKQPEFDLGQAPNEKLYQAIERIDWSQLNSPISIAQTLDNRRIIIVKALSRDPDITAKCQRQALFIFVERLGPVDMPHLISNLSENGEEIFQALTTPLNNTFGSTIRFSSSYSSALGGHSETLKIQSLISADMANEFYAQNLTQSTST